MHLSYGARKCEASALARYPVAARELCKQAILRHVDRTRIPEFRAAHVAARGNAKQEIERQLREYLRETR
jgi:hypothetical protein